LAVTDNGQQKAFVLGEPVGRDALPELSEVTMRVRINSAEVATARGDAVLGHPYNSVSWLASKLAQFGERISAGDYIMSGSFTRQFPLAQGIGLRRCSTASGRSRPALSDAGARLLGSFAPAASFRTIGPCRE
jgi:2-keto-4-pentenoate hydratase